MYAAAPFDRLAAGYDRSFTASAIGLRMRAAVWARLDAAFHPGDRVLELNCGTGEDAVYLGKRGVRVLATDISPGMIATARAKVVAAGLSERVGLARLAIEDLDIEGLPGPFDGVLSNFGGFNCVEELPGLACALAATVRPGGRALLCVMGPVVPWEWGWFLARGEPWKAIRRLRRKGVPWHGLTIRYPSVGEVRRAFAPYFVQRRVAAIGALVPPTFAESWATRHPRLLAALGRLERRAETVWPLPWLADHFLIELERVSERIRR